MSIIDTKQISNNAKLEQTESNIRKVNIALHDTIKRQHSYIFNTIWYNPDGLSAQDIFDAFGTESHELFTFSQSIQTLLHQIDSNYIPLSPPNDYTINADGTVTVGELKIVPVEETIPEEGIEAPEEPL